MNPHRERDPVYLESVCVLPPPLVATVREYVMCPTAHDMASWVCEGFARERAHIANMHLELYQHFVVNRKSRYALILTRDPESPPIDVILFVFEREFRMLGYVVRRDKCGEHHCLWITLPTTQP